MVPPLVAPGEDVGVCVGASKLVDDAGLIALPLAGVPMVKVGALYQGMPFPALQNLLDAMTQAAVELAPPGSAFAAAAAPASAKAMGHKKAQKNGGPSRRLGEGR